MCTHRHTIINPYNGKELVVNCGHCPACKQEKAIKRTQRIKNHYSSELSCAFVTLTYRNECVPYIRSTDLFNCNQSYNLHTLLDDEYNFHLPIYRDSDTRWVAKSLRDKKTGKIVRDDYGKIIKKICRKRSFYTHQIGEAVVNYSDIDLTGQSFKFLRKRDDGAIGVIFYKDLQDFIKRVRINLTRKNYGFSQNSFFAVAELGPTSGRPHFHLLFFFPKGYYTEAKNVLSSSWSYDDYRRTFENIELARDASAYVSNYVNCDASIPRLFENCRDLRPKHTFSHAFGFAQADFSPNKVIEKVFDGNLRFDCTRVRNGNFVSVTSLLPSYVLSRYFPRFKGFSRLTDNEIYRIVTCPQSIGIFAKQCLLTHDDCLKIYRLLKNKHQFFKDFGINIFDYARAYSRAWTVYRSNVLRDFHDSINLINDYFYAYDNIADYYKGFVRNDFLDKMMFYLPVDFSFESDFNKFPNMTSRTIDLEQKYHAASKDKKIRSDIYSTVTQFNI